VLDAASATTGASVLRGAAWSLAGQTVPQLYLIVISVVAARMLGPRMFGRQSFIALVEITAITLLSAGIPSMIARFVADALGRGDEQFALRITRLGWWIETPGALLATAALIAVALSGATPRAAWLFAALAVGAGILSRVPTSLLTGVQHWRVQTVIGLSIGAVAVAATVAALELGYGVSGMFAVEAATTVAGLLLFGWHALRARSRLASGARSVTERRPSGAEVYRFAAFASINAVFTFIVWRRTEIFFLRRYAPAQEMGFYSIAFAAANAPVLALQGLIGVLMPAIATLHGAGAIDRIRTGFARSLRLLLLIALPTTALAIALGPELIRLVYGKEYRAAGPPLMILLAVLPLVPLASLSGVLLGGMGRLRVLVSLNIVASIANIALDFLLIPGHGVKGAALASGLAQLTVAVPVVIYSAKMLGSVRWEFGALVGTAAAAAPAGLAAWACVYSLGGVPGLVAGTIAGSIAFVLLAGWLRILTPGDATWLEETVGRLLGGVPGRIVRFWAQPS